MRILPAARQRSNGECVGDDLQAVVTDTVIVEVKDLRVGDGMRLELM